jgi:hypothetical protein
MQRRAFLLRWRADRGPALELWNRIDSASWPARLHGGDLAAWYEMLLGYMLDSVPHDAIFGPLADDSAFGRTGLGRLGFSRLDAQNEAQFYDALKRATKGDAAGANASMRRVVESDHRRYVEYAMARELLRANPDWPASAPLPMRR